jgi:serine/threonine-protein kinase
MKSGGWRFGSFVLVPSEHELLCRGKPVRLPRKDFELLVTLVERHGQLVRKEELLQQLWPDAFVEDGNLTKHVSTLRKALDDNGQAGPAIETVPKVGFRFVLPVTPLEADQSRPLTVPAAPRRLTITIVGLAALALITIAVAKPWKRVVATHEWKALAVLPFTPLAGQKEPVEHLGIGLADGIITRLSGQRLLAVRPTSVVKSRASGRTDDLTALGRELQADIVLQGHMQRAGDIVRVTVQLSDVERGAPIWGDTFDQPTAELFRLEDTIADRVAGALRLQIGAAEQQRIRRRYTENAEAYDAYLAGRDAMLRYTPEGTRSAVASFEQALTLDAGYALARAGLAMASADMYLRFASADTVQQWGERAEHEASAALAMDPDLAEAHAARAAVLRKREFDWIQAIEESRRALTLNPNMDQPHLVAAAAFYHLGLMDRARAELDAARQAGSADQIEMLRIDALTALFSGDWSAARRRLEDVSGQSSRAIGDVYLALTYFYTGEPERSRALLNTLTGDKAASTAARSAAALASVLAASHDPAGARRLVESVLQNRYSDHHVAYSLGAAYSQLGDVPSAVQWLRTAADAGFPCEPWFRNDPLLGPLQKTAEFNGLLAELERKRAANAARFPQ